VDADDVADVTKARILPGSLDDASPFGAGVVGYCYDGFLLKHGKAIFKIFRQ